MKDAWKECITGISILLFLPPMSVAGDKIVGKHGNGIHQPPFTLKDKCGNRIGINRPDSAESKRNRFSPLPGEIWLYTALQDGSLMRRIHQINKPATDGGNKFLAMEPLIEGGPGWNAFQHLFSLNGRIYAVTKDRELVWYEGQGNGDSDGYAGWTGPNAGIRDRDRLEFVFPMGSYENNSQFLGVLYTIDENGDVWWYRHRFVEVVEGCRKIDNARWDGPQKVKSKFPKYTQVFSGGDGIIYGLDEKGDLTWQRHDNWATGGTLWEEPRQVHLHIKEVTQIFGAGQGNIYTVDNQGNLKYYRHIGWRDGSGQWEEKGVPIGGVPKLHTIFAYAPLPSGIMP